MRTQLSNGRVLHEVSHAHDPTFHLIKSYIFNKHFPSHIVVGIQDYERLLLKTHPIIWTAPQTLVDQPEKLKALKYSISLSDSMTTFQHKT